MPVTWDHDVVYRLDLPGCGGARPLPVPEADSSSVDESSSSEHTDMPCPDGAADTCGEEAKGGPISAGTDDPLVESGSFTRLLLSLAAEHRRELERLRAKLEAEKQISPDDATVAWSGRGANSVSQPECEVNKECSSISSGQRPSSSRRHAELPRMASRKRQLADECVSGIIEEIDKDLFGKDEQGAPSDAFQEGNPSTCHELDRMPSTFSLRNSRGSYGRIRLAPPKLDRSQSAKLGAFLTRCVQSQVFDAVSGLFILLNSVLIGWAADISAGNASRGLPPDDMPWELQMLNISFTVWFTIELVLRAAVAGLRNFFTTEDWSWNVFDSITVGTDLIHGVLEVSNTIKNDSVAGQNLTVVRMLRILRITRAIRMVRLIRFFRELRMMVLSVLKSGSSLLWSMLMVITTVYIFGIYFVQVVAYHVSVNGHPPTDTPEFSGYKTMEGMFGSLLRSIYTLYLTVSNGISWGEVSSVLISIDPMHGFVLCFFTFFTTFALLNIITGIFVDTSINCAQSDKREVIWEQLHRQKSALSQMEKLFQNGDKDGSGYMSFEEFENHLQSKEVRAHFQALGIEVDKVRGLFRLLDVDTSGELSLDEFVRGCMKLKGPAKSMDLARLMDEYMKMSDDWEHFFIWTDKQFRRLHRSQETLERRLDGLLDPE